MELLNWRVPTISPSHVKQNWCVTLTANDKYMMYLQAGAYVAGVYRFSLFLSPRIYCKKQNSTTVIAMCKWTQKSIDRKSKNAHIKQQLDSSKRSDDGKATMYDMWCLYGCVGANVFCIDFNALLNNNCIFSLCDKLMWRRSMLSLYSQSSSSLSWVVCIVWYKQFAKCFTYVTH